MKCILTYTEAQIKNFVENFVSFYKLPKEFRKKENIVQVPVIYSYPILKE